MSKFEGDQPIYPEDILATPQSDESVVSDANTAAQGNIDTPVDKGVYEARFKLRKLSLITLDELVGAGVEDARVLIDMINATDSLDTDLMTISAEVSSFRSPQTNPEESGHLKELAGLASATFGIVTLRDLSASGSVTGAAFDAERTMIANYAIDIIDRSEIPESAVEPLTEMLAKVHPEA